MARILLDICEDSATEKTGPICSSTIGNADWSACQKEGVKPGATEWSMIADRTSIL
ncbi:hypothetical protein [Acetonema longum]|uniref:hypothetical protein n=1 Tax=Acetonema longum TaxID=2374 RepID=UPI00145DBF0A|nr:hypothetical protein [Acetonema longum]